MTTIQDRKSRHFPPGPHEAEGVGGGEPLLDRASLALEGWHFLEEFTDALAHPVAERRAWCLPERFRRD